MSLIKILFYRLAFSHPKALAKMLDVPAYLVNHFVAILAVLCEKEAETIPEEFEAFCNSFLDWYHASKNLCWNYQNTSVHIPYLHGGMYVYYREF